MPHPATGVKVVLSLAHAFDRYPRLRLIHVNYSCRFLLPHRRMLPNSQPLLIDAHGSDVSQSFLIDLTIFG